MCRVLEFGGGGGEFFERDIDKLFILLHQEVFSSSADRAPSETSHT